MPAPPLAAKAIDKAGRDHVVARLSDDVLRRWRLIDALADAIKEYHEEDHPRDDHGRWTDAGGSEISSGGNDGNGEPAGDVGEFRRGNRTITYSKKHFELQGDKLIPKRPLVSGTSLIDKSADVIHRGMSNSEYTAMLATGTLHSVGHGNVGRGERGLTFFTAEPKTAVMYAQVGPTSSMDNPAYVVSINRPDQSRIHIDRDHGFELGVSGDILLSDIVGVYRGNVVEQSLRDGLKVPTPHQFDWQELKRPISTNTRCLCFENRKGDTEAPPFPVSSRLVRSGPVTLVRSRLVPSRWSSQVWSRHVSSRLVKSRWSRRVVTCLVTSGQVSLVPSGRVSSGLVPSGLVPSCRVGLDMSRQVRFCLVRSRRVGHV
jgi:hypothetical protein